MVASFPEVDGSSQVGLSVGVIASAFALAQFGTNFFWGWLSDRIGRKPVILTGTLLTAVCFVGFGFCRTLWQAILVQALMGLVNGNQAVVSTCLGEITDRSNQSRAFVYLPVIYGIGGVTGPAVGGLMVMRNSRYPYLLPNLFSAAILVADLILTMIFLAESLEEAKKLPPLGRRVEDLLAWLWHFARSTWPMYVRQSHFEGGERDRFGEDACDSDEDSGSQLSMPALLPSVDSILQEEIFNRHVLLLLSTYLIFQLSNIAFNSLFPIFAHDPPPTGRDLSTGEIGLSLSFAGIVAIIFQVGIFGKLREQMGNKSTYRAGLFGFVLSMMMMPWVGYKESHPPFGWGTGKYWLWAEMGFVLLVKTVAAVGGLTSALLLVSLERT
jgi:MFS family permease